MSTVLKRQPVECDGSVILDKAQELGHAELMRRAVKLQCPPRDHWGRPTLLEPSLTQIEEAMASLGIEPYTEDSVAVYKNKIDNSLILRNLPANIAAVGAPILLGGTILAAPFWVLATSILMLVGLSVPGLGVSGLTMLTLFILGVALAGSIDNGHIKKVAARWFVRELEFYDLKQVPDFALQTAVDLSERCPGIRLYVEECYIREEMIDPFLVVAHGPHRWYIEVWNEPGFEK